MSDILRERLTQNGCGGMSGKRRECRPDVDRPGAKGAGTFAPLAPLVSQGRSRAAVGHSDEGGQGWGAGRGAMDALGSGGRGQSPA